MKFQSCPSEDHALLSLSILLSAEVSHLKGVQPIMKAGTHTRCSTSPDDEGGGKTAQQRHCQPHPRQGPIPHHHLRASLLPPQRKWKICQKCVASVSHLEEWEWKEIIFLKWYWILETDLNIAIGMTNSWTVGWCIVLGGGWYRREDELTFPATHHVPDILPRVINILWGSRDSIIPIM